MKKIIFLVGLLFTFLNSFSQEIQEAEHMTFKGIPINGKLSDFVSEMKNKGFTFGEHVVKDDIVIMSGDFAGKPAVIYILATPESKTVWKVGVFYDKQDTWLSLKLDYLQVKDVYSKKYGEPDYEKEYFFKPYYEGDGYELQAIKAGKCIYYSSMKTDTGSISIQINKLCEIQISYEDKLNSELNIKEKENSALNDI